MDFNIEHLIFITILAERKEHQNQLLIISYLMLLSIVAVIALINA